MDYQTQMQFSSSGMGIGVLIVMLLVGLAVFLFFGYCFKMMAEKTGNDSSLWWVPILNFLIPIRIAEKPSWWIILMLIPFVNIIVNVIVWMEVAKRRGKDQVWGILAALVSVVGIPYLAFSE